MRSQFKDLGPDGRKFLGKFLKKRAVAVELLGEFPLSMPDYQDFHLRATDIVARLRRMADGIIPANVPAEEFTAEVNALVKVMLERANVRRFKVSESDIARRLNAGFRQELNERPWQTIGKTFSTSVGNRPAEITSTISPAEQLGHSQEEPRGPIAGRYPEGVHGYMCHSADANHALNLAVTKLTVADPGGEPKLAFCGVRHSMHCAWEIQNAQDRAAANARRAEEAVMAAFTLFNQCRNIFALKGERKDSHDAYKAAARIAVLSHLIGKVPCFNCKSGKDRTGEMDVECKFLSALIARGEPIPEPGAKLTEAQKGLFRAVALQGGNFEVQKMNVGVAGFMSGRVESISERLGGKAYHTFHRGGANHVAK